MAIKKISCRKASEAIERNNEGDLRTQPKPLRKEQVECIGEAFKDYISEKDACTLLNNPTFLAVFHKYLALGILRQYINAPSCVATFIMIKEELCDMFACCLYDAVPNELLIPVVDRCIGSATVQIMRDVAMMMLFNTKNNGGKAKIKWPESMIDIFDDVMGEEATEKLIDNKQFSKSFFELLSSIGKTPDTATLNDIYYATICAAYRELPLRLRLVAVNKYLETISWDTLFSLLVESFCREGTADNIKKMYKGDNADKVLLIKI